MANQRSPLAVPFELYDGEVVLWLMPFTTYKNNVVQSQFERIVPRSKKYGVKNKDGVFEPGWDEYGNCFVMLEGNVVDAEFKESLRPRASVWQAFWQARTGDLEARWNAYTAVATLWFNSDFWEAYRGTRDATFDADDAIKQPDEDADPKS